MADPQPTWLWERYYRELEALSELSWKYFTGWRRVAEQIPE